MEREQRDLKECSFAPKLVAQSHSQLQLSKARRQLARLAEQQRALLLNLGDVRSADSEEVFAQRSRRSSVASSQAGAGPLPSDEDVNDETPRSSQRSLQFEVGCSAVLQQLEQVEEEAHRIVAFLVKKGIKCVVEDPDPSALCGDFDSGLARRIRREEAWLNPCQELQASCSDASKMRSSAGPLSASPAKVGGA